MNTMTRCYIRSHLDASALTFNYDAIVDPRLKDGCCKKVPWQEYMTLSAADMRYVQYWTDLITYITIVIAPIRLLHLLLLFSVELTE